MVFPWFSGCFRRSEGPLLGPHELQKPHRVGLEVRALREDRWQQDELDGGHHHQEGVEEVHEPRLCFKRPSPGASFKRLKKNTPRKGLKIIEKQ